MNNHEILIVVGTRPELIKIAPIANELKRRGEHRFSIVSTGQHQDMLEELWSVFGLQPTYELNIISPGQSLASLTSKAITEIDRLFAQLTTDGKQPKVVIAQGDTTTVMASSIICFYHKIKFLHVEAGLRTNDLLQPFPEEFNRRVAAISAFHHFAPTTLSRQNLVAEGIETNAISIVGNTIVDAVEEIRLSHEFQRRRFAEKRVQEAYDSDNRLVLITCHRRENQNQNLDNILAAIAALSKKHPKDFFVWPIHPNPAVKQRIEGALHLFADNVILCPPLNYIELLKILNRACMAISDSGGIQEEGPAFQTPVLILRNTTERPEAVEVGYNKMVGTETEMIVEGFESFRPDYTNFVNPYGDGTAASRIADFALRCLTSCS